MTWRFKVGYAAATAIIGAVDGAFLGGVAAIIGSMGTIFLGWLAYRKGQASAPAADGAVSEWRNIAVELGRELAGERRRIRDLERQLDRAQRGQ